MSGVAAQEIVFQVVVVQFEVKLHHRLSPRWGWPISHSPPTAYAVGFNLWPLRGLGLNPPYGNTWNAALLVSVALGVTR